MFNSYGKLFVISLLPDRSGLAVVAYYDRIVAEPRFRRYYGSLFGLFIQSVPAILSGWFLLCQHVCFDDLTVQDLGSMKGSARHFIISLAPHIGSPFQPEKHQAMQSQSGFLGLIHDVIVLVAWPSCSFLGR